MSTSKILLSFTLFVAVLEAGLGGCKSKSQPAEVESRALVKKLIEPAVRQANDGNPIGLLGLYEMSQHDAKYGAEYGADARNALQRLLYSKTKLWVETFANLEPGKFDWTCASVVELNADFPLGVSSNSDFQARVAKKLKAYHGTGKENVLARRIAAVFDPDGPCGKKN